MIGIKPSNRLPIKLVAKIIFKNLSPAVSGPLHRPPTVSTRLANRVSFAERPSMTLLPIAAAAMMLNSILVIGAARLMSKHESERNISSLEFELPGEIQGL